MEAQSNIDIERLADLAYQEYLDSKEFARLEEALQHLITLVEDTSLDEIEKVGRLSFKYARCLQTRFERGKDPKEIANAIDFAELSIKNCPELPDSKRCLLLAERRSLLWKCLVSQDDSLSCKDPDAFDKAFKLAEEIDQDLAANGIQGIPRIESLRRIGISYQLRWDKNGDFSDLEKSLRFGQEVMASLPEDDVSELCSDALSDMAFRLQRAFIFQAALEPTETEVDNSRAAVASPKAIELLKQSFKLDSSRPLKQIKNVMEFTSNIGQLPQEQRGPMLGGIFELLRDCILLLDDAIQTSLEFDLQEYASSADSLPRLAAAAALEKGESVYSAICLLEKGLGLAKSALFETTTTRDIGLRSDIPGQLRAQYVEAWTDLRSVVSDEAPSTLRRQLLGRLRSVETEIHSSMGTNRFTDALDEKSVLNLASSYPIAIVNMTDCRSDVLLITSGGFETVPLPDLDWLELFDLSWEIQHRLAQGREDLYHEAHNYLLKMLKKIWVCIVKPVLDHLGYRRHAGPLSAWPQICWIPTGILSLYPLHAAGLGLHRKKENAINRVISTYAPSLKSLLRGRRAISDRQASIPASPPSAAVLAMIQTKGLPPEDIWENPEDAPERHEWPMLKYSESEAMLVHRFFPKSQAPAATEFNATTAEAVKVLEMGVPIVHLSCHGYVNYIYPTKSMLLFDDWEANPLSVKVIDKLRISSELVVLSACFTANSGVDNLLDESFQLTSSLFDAGFPRVVGSLWGIAQEQTRDFVSGFYSYLGQNHGGSITTRCVAEACHAATLEVARRSVNDASTIGEPLFWSPFICIAV